MTIFYPVILRRKVDLSSIFKSKMSKKMCKTTFEVTISADDQAQIVRSGTNSNTHVLCGVLEPRTLKTSARRRFSFLIAGKKIQYAIFLYC